MRGHLNLPLAAVFADDAVHVDRQTSVWVDSHTEQARIGLQNTHFRNTRGVRKLMIHFS